MPEARDRLPGRWVGHFPPGLASRPGFSLREGSGAENGRRLSATDNKENILPGGGRRRLRRAARNRPKRSPLPSWYPRTPLRDITNIVNIMEWRRTRQRPADDSGERNQPTATEVTAMPLASPLTLALVDSEETPPIQASASSESDVSPRLRPVTPEFLESKPQLVDIVSLPKSTTGATDQYSVMGNMNFEELDRIFKEKFQIATKMHLEKKPARSILMLMR